MEILINLANVLYVVAYFTNNIVRLRVLTLVAATCLAIYFGNQPVPMLNVVAWNLAFIALNLVQLARVIAAGRTRGDLAASG
jgi:hypothetical protein